jgi:predicted permease
MSLLTRVTSLYRNLLRKPRVETDLNEELRASLDFIAEEKIAAGMSPQQARREARIELGGLEQTKERVREARVGASLERIWRDLGYGLRLLRKNPRFAAIVVITLALGIGANTAVFSIIEGAFLDPFPYDASHDIISIRAASGGMWVPLTARDVLSIRRQIQSVELVTAYLGERMNLTGDGESVGVRVVRSTARMFPLLGMDPLVGQVFTEEDEVPGRNHVAVLGHDVWQRWFMGDSAVLGESIVLNDTPYTVVGIMPPRFQYGDGAIWIPLFLDPEPLEGAALFCHALLGERSNLDEVNAELMGILEPAGSSLRRIIAGRLIDEVLDDVKLALIVLMAVAGLILLIACANVAGLMMVRSIVRAREVAMRVALGAGRARVIGQLFTENALLAVLGGAVGYVVAHIGVETILALIPAGYIPVEARVEVSLPMLALTFGIATVVSVVFGTSPAWRFSSSDVQESLKEGGRRIVGEGRGRRRARRALVVVQVALTLVLLMSAGLLLNSFTRLLRVDPGFEPQDVVTLDITLPAGRYSESHQVIGFYDELLSRIGSKDGVDAVSGSNRIPLAFWPLIRDVVVESDGVEEYTVHQVEYRQVTRGYFLTFGISVVEGRGFEVTDVRESPAVAIVNQAFVHELLPDGRALERLIRIEPRKLSASWTKIVGVIEDVKQHRIDGEVDPEVYQLYAQAPEPAPSLTLSMRTRLPLADILDATRSELRDLDTNVSVLGLEPMETFVDYGLGGHRVAVFLTGLFAALALVLTLVGLYGLIAYRVSQRAQEIGLRMALGASPLQILREIISRGLGLVARGMGLGVVVSLISFHSLERLLFGVKPYDPATMLIVIAAMFLVAALACYLPARRIYRVDPGITLHYE